MIVWLASYPKSGNTWLRAFITSLLSKSTGENSLENMTAIRAYPLTDDFYNLLDDFSDFKKIAKNWETSQNIINLQKKIKILKTHHQLCKIDNFLFTNYKNSLATIYVVRDPRNVITSLMHHYSLKNYDEALKFIFDEHRFSGRLDKKENLKRRTEFPTYISSWQNHFNSWKNFKKNFLLIKYEDLINRPEKTFNRISKFLEIIINIKITNEKINEAIIKSSFKNLKKSEEKFGFSEAPISDLNETKKFFNLGPKNDWKNLLPNQIRLEIEKRFQKEMMELGYLKS
ncbi:sulfotransferase domain-containing protein [Candidatus Pelagibacter sp.]|nr:sulfotransferase domain-containing protein [Candidatus Pelagibacter sp.]